MLTFSSFRPLIRANFLPRSTLRTICVTPITYTKQLPPRLVINENDIEEAFLKGSGPGGQKINKTSSAVQLKHLPTGIVVKSQATRSRSQNRKIARQLLSEKLEFMDKGDESRTAIKVEVKRKKKASKTKKSKRKYKALEEKDGSTAGNDEVSLTEEDLFDEGAHDHVTEVAMNERTI